MRRTFILPLAIVFSASAAYAGAWTQAKGAKQLILTSSAYSASQLFNDKGSRRPQASFRKYELNPYFEYGLRDDLTLGANLSLQRASQSANGGSRAQSNIGLGDSEFFMRKRLWNSNGWVVSAEPLIKLPSFQSSGEDIPKLGGSHGDIAMGLSTGYGFSAYQLNHFFNLDTQYRARLGPAKNQVRLSATAGVRVSEKWMVMPQLFSTYRTIAPRSAAFTQSSRDDYNQLRAQLSLVYTLSDQSSLQLGAFKDVDGKNIGNGKGVLFALWTRW